MTSPLAGFRELTPRDLGWIAGFLEGEGSFIQMKKGSVRVCAAQVQKEPLERLRALVGGVASFRNTPFNPRWKPVSQWYLHGPKAIGLMMTIYAMMSPRRREQIRKVIDGWKQRRSYGHLTHCRHGHPYNEVNSVWRNTGSGTRRRYCRACRHVRSGPAKRRHLKRRRWRGFIAELERACAG